MDKYQIVLTQYQNEEMTFNLAASELCDLAEVVTTHKDDDILSCYFEDESIEIIIDFSDKTITTKTN